MYHKIRYGEKNQEIKKNKPKGGWDEDDRDYSIKQSGSNYSTTNNYQRPAIGKPEINVEKQNSNFNSNYNYKQPVKEVQSKPKISIETRIIEDLLQPTGIIIRPSENQLKEFVKRIKSLDREVIFDLLNENLSNYENMSDANNTKILMKCLYILEYIAQNKVELLNQAFSERLEIIENIRDYFSNNKKLVDLSNSVLHAFNPNQYKSTNTINNMNTTNEDPVRNKFDLLNLNSENKKREDKNSNLLDLNFAQASESKTSNTNLLDNIFEGEEANIQDKKPITSKIQNENQKSFKFLKKTNKTETNTAENIFLVLGSENDTTHTNNLNNSNSGNIINLENGNEAVPKKNFAFIKSKDKEKNIQDKANVINNLNIQVTESKLINNKNSSYQPANFDIFDTLPVSTNTSNQDTFNKNIVNSIADSIPVIDMTKNFHQSNKIENYTDFDQIFNTRNSNINFNPHSIDNNLSSGLNNLNMDLNSRNDFNYNHLGNHVEIYKNNSNDKDAFSFVSDMLKSKKN